MLKTILKFLAFSSCLLLLTYCSKDPDPVIGSDFNFNCDSPLTICAMPDSIGTEFAQMDCDGGGISNVLECRNGTDFREGDDDCAAAVRGKIDICMLIRVNPNDSTSNYDPDHVLAQNDCDGGGLTNIEECVQGFNPIKGNDIDELNSRDDNLEIQAYLRKIEYITVNDTILDSIGVLAIIEDSLEVYKTETGLIYVIETIGLGELAAAEDTITYNFQSSYLQEGNITSITSTALDTSKVRDLIFGMQEAITHFPEGSKGRLIMPSRLAYNNLSFAGIPAYSVIVMDFELVRIF